MSTNVRARHYEMSAEEKDFFSYRMNENMRLTDDEAYQ